MDDKSWFPLDESSASKSRRAANFNEREKQLLHKLLDRYKSVLLNKSLNTDFVQLKRVAWKRLTKEFNEETTETTPRTTANLQTLVKYQLGHGLSKYEAPEDGELEALTDSLKTNLLNGEFDSDSCEVDSNQEERSDNRDRRTPNFTEVDKQLLTSLILPHKDTLLNPGNTKQIIMLKNNAWTQITNQFNKANKIRRSTKHLQTFWKRMKAERMTLLNKLQETPVWPVPDENASLFCDTASRKSNEYSNDSSVPFDNDSRDNSETVDVDVDIDSFQFANSSQSDKSSDRAVRTPNFTHHERKLLHEIVDRYKSVILSPKVNTEYIRLKNAAWQRVASEFNAINSVPRDAEKLKTCLKHMKAHFATEFPFRAAEQYEFLKTQRILEQDLLRTSQTSESRVDTSVRVSPKYKRSANFTWGERQLLLRLVQPHKRVLMNPKTCSSTWVEKKNAWMKITVEFNKVNKTNRKMSELQIAWKNYKSSVKRRSQQANSIDTDANDNIQSSALDNFEKTSADSINSTAVASAYFPRTHSSAENHNFSISPSESLQKSTRSHVDVKDVKRVNSLVALTSNPNSRLEPDASRLVNVSFSDVSMPKVPKITLSSTMAHDPIATSSISKLKSTEHSEQCVLNNYMSAYNDSTTSRFVSDQIVAENDPSIPSNHSFTRMPVIAYQYEQMLDARINLHRLHLDILRENAEMQRTREQEESDLLKTFDEQLYQLKCEQEDEIHELTLAKIRQDLQLLKSEFK